MKHLFAYGTLMCPDIMREVSGSHFANVKGTLRGYSRLSIKGEIYPAIIPNEGSFVEGVVYKNISSKAWGRLDRFEGELYKRQSVMINLENSNSLRSESYILRPKYINILEDTEWDFNNFLSLHKTYFLSDYRGFLELKKAGMQDCRPASKSSRF